MFFSTRFKHVSTEIRIYAYFVDVSGNYGWKKVDGDRVAYWGGNTGNEGCTGGQCECNNGGSSDAGELTDKDVSLSVYITMKHNCGRRGEEGVPIFVKC